MRLDLFLKKTRLVRTRSRANELCKQSKVTINDIQAKPGKIVKPHDTVGIDFGKRLLIVRITAIPERNVKKEDAKLYYSVLRDEAIDSRI